MVVREVVDDVHDVKESFLGPVAYSGRPDVNWDAIGGGCFEFARESTVHVRTSAVRAQSTPMYLETTSVLFRIGMKP